MAMLKDNQKIRVRIFMEVMGWPKENLRPHLENIIALMKDKMHWKILKEEHAEPDKKGEKMYSTHVELEADAPNAQELFMFSLMFGPSVIEILDPAELYINAGELQDILSDVISKVQGMDKEIKVLAAQNKKYTGLMAMLEKKGILRKEPLNDKKDSK